MIEDIEKLTAKVEACPLRQAKVPLKREIELGCSGPAQDISTQISLLTGWSRDESHFVENLPSGILRSKELKRFAWDDVRTVA